VTTPQTPRLLPDVLQQYEVKEERLGKDRRRVVVSLPGQASAVERVFLGSSGYDRRALLWRAHNSVTARPRRPAPPQAPRRPEGVSYWRAHLDDLAKRAGWEPHWEGDYKVSIGTGLSRHGHPAAIYSLVRCNGSGLVARICSTAPDDPHVAETLHTDKPSALAGWLRAKRIEYRDGAR
jgi:hypothetical protein